MSRKMGKRWQGVVRISGKQHTRMFDTRREAQAWETEQRQKATRAEKQPKTQATVQLDSSIKVWLSERHHEVSPSTYDTDRLVMDLFMKHVGNKRLSSVKPRTIQTVIDKWMKTLSVSSVRRYCDSLSAFFRWCTKRQYFLDNPFLQVYVPRRPKRVAELSPWDWDELDDLTKDLSPFHRLVIRTLARTGIRWGEARALRVGDMKIAGDVPVFIIRRSQTEGQPEKTPKSGWARSVPIAADILDDLQELAFGRRSSEYLLSMDGRSQLWRSSFQRSTNWSDWAGGRTLHDLRHTAACNWLTLGVPINSVQRWLGHAELETTQIYVTYLGLDIDSGAYSRLNKG